MPPLFLASLAYLGLALPSATLGLLWPSMRLSFGVPVGALGLLLVPGFIASVLASAGTGRVLSRVRVGPLVAVSTVLSAVALADEALAPSPWVFAGGVMLYGLSFGAIDAALNAHAAGHFGARDINWMHASYGLGATLGPLAVTALRSGGIGWRWTYGMIAAVQVALGCVLILARRNWPPVPGTSRALPDAAGHRKPPLAIVLTALAFTATETGIEAGAGIWGYIFLTAGRGLPDRTAGLAVSAYWATMFAGRVILGPVAERVGPSRLLAVAVAGVPAGAALMALPGPGMLAAIGMMILGLAAAPVFPLLTLTTAQRMGDDTNTTLTVSLQVAASAIGGTALPAGLGLAIEVSGAAVLGPVLLGLGLAMCGVFGLLSRLAGRVSRV